ncbi:fibronectin type III domain-containing protein [Elusimicrobiota bacterium]
MNKYLKNLIRGLITGAIILFSGTVLPVSAASDTIDVTLTVNPVHKIKPDRVTDLTSLTNQDEVDLLWTAPQTEWSIQVKGYQIRWSTNSLADLLNDTTAWWDQAAGINDYTYFDSPGDSVTYTVNGLIPADTHYFSIKAVDDFDNIGLIDLNTFSGSQPYAYIPGDLISPARITDLSALSDDTGKIILSWTAPGDDGAAGTASQYLVKYATFSITQLGGDTTNWWNQSENVSEKSPVSDPGTSGTEESLTVTGLSDGTTYYFAIKARDEIPNISLIDTNAESGNQAFAVPVDLIPSAPEDLAAAVGDKFVKLTWSANTESDLDHYNIYQSTVSLSSDYILIDSAEVTASPEYTVSGLRNNKRYYFMVTAVDFGLHESTYTAAVSAMPKPDKDSIAPRQPGGLKLKLHSGGNKLTISWSEVKKDVNGKPCTDLKGYNIYMSDRINGKYSIIKLVPAGTHSWTDKNIKGEVYYYYLRAIDNSGNESKCSMVVDSSVDCAIHAVDEKDRLAHIRIPREANSMLYKKSNDYGEDILIDVDRNEDEEREMVLKSYSFVAKGEKSRKSIRSFKFDKPLIDITLTYGVKGGKLAGAPAVSAAEAEDNLAIFWYNGLEWIKFGGDVSTKDKTVSVRSNRVGKYIVKYSRRADSFAIISSYPEKVFTPNGDGWNDYFEVICANPYDSDVKGKIYDVNGAYVADMEETGQISDENLSLRWDGRKSDGSVADSGIYIYQIEASGRDSKIINGTVVIAK